MDDTLYRRTDKPHLPGYVGWRGAGVVLTWLGLCSHGATCPFAAVLCAEWMHDPRRIQKHRRRDRTALSAAIGGSAYWAMTTFAMSVVHPELGLLLFQYWCAFLLWLVIRALTRWRQIDKLRRLDAAVPTLHPHTGNGNSSESG